MPAKRPPQGKEAPRQRMSQTRVCLGLPGSAAVGSLDRWRLDLAEVDMLGEGGGELRRDAKWGPSP